MDQDKRVQGSWSVSPDYGFRGYQRSSEARPGSSEARPGSSEARPRSSEARPGSSELRPKALLEPKPENWL
ncbi:MAG: hypothetical protein F6J94_28205 [Moorea sp. SIO1F2]|uniref:hypothetical protein n=1 Tax=Moorena sp. SIO1F2 TaxID=2607819 RepID=UPI0013BAE4F2|nr:hypothetical protein [Moorena sp. SIO1F2]NET85635.1 hypothetical protein [Moorena sp. SIO1F2]